MNDSRRFFGILSEKNEKKMSKKDLSWSQESFYFEKGTNKQPAMPRTQMFTRSSFSDRRYRFFLIFFFIFFSSVSAYLFYLQIIKGGEYFSLAENNRRRSLPLPAERGTITDRFGAPLTENIPRFSLAIIPQDLPHKNPSGVKRENVVRRLSEITGRSASELRSDLDKYGNYSFQSVVIQENLDYETALKILISSTDLPGIYLGQGSRRHYINEFGEEKTKYLSLSHVIGYMGKINETEWKEKKESGYLLSDYLGKSGLEKQYETELRGTYGEKIVEVDALGRSQKVISTKSPIPGENIRLSLDLNLQMKLEKIIAEHLKKNEKTKAAAIAIDPRDGSILALLSAPGFDNNDFSGGISQEKYQQYISDTNKPLFNRVIGGQYPSGSTIKPALASAALQASIININTSFLSTGGIGVGRWFFPDWLSGGHGLTDVKKSLAWSVNTFYYYIGGGYKNFQGLGPEKIFSYLSLFGFGSKLGIDLPGEISGFIPTPEWKQEKKGEQWYIGDSYNLSIGQGDLSVTPLQIATMTAAIANGGTLYQPKLVKSFESPSETREAPATIIRQNFIDPNNLSIVRQGMRDCVEYGSCRGLYGMAVKIAGKTGTAQWSSEKPPHAWFTSFAPFDQPKIVFTILVEEGVEGSKIAAAIARDFYREWTLINNEY